MHPTAPLLMATIGAVASGANSVRAEDIDAKAGPITVESLAKLNNPWGMAFLPDGRLLITEKPGTLRIYSSGTLSEPVRGVPNVVFFAQGGLLDVAVDPDFANNGLVYLSYTEAAEQQPENASNPPDPRLGEFHDEKDTTLKGTAVARGRLDGSELHDVKVIWRQVPPMVGREHFSGRLAFSPDGKLFITSGDRQRFEPAQDLGSNLGKIVRINPDGSIPEDNPFVNQKGALPEIWSYGHRNALGIAFEPASKQLWAHEMGPKGGDEVNHVEKGQNYGWPVVSNGDNYDDTTIPDHPTRPEFIPPIKYWNPSISPSGLQFYTGTLFPTWRGNALLGGLSSQALLRLTVDGGKVTDEERIDMKRRIRDVAQAPDGAVLLLSDGEDGALLRLTPKHQ